MEKESTRDIGKTEAQVGLENKANKITYQWYLFKQNTDNEETFYTLYAMPNVQNNWCLKLNFLKVD